MNDLETSGVNRIGHASVSNVAIAKLRSLAGGNTRSLDRKLGDANPGEDIVNAFAEVFAAMAAAAAPASNQESEIPDSVGESSTVQAESTSEQSSDSPQTPQRIVENFQEPKPEVAIEEAAENPIHVVEQTPEASEEAEQEAKLETQGLAGIADTENEGSSTDVVTAEQISVQPVAIAQQQDQSRSSRRSESDVEAKTPIVAPNAEPAAAEPIKSPPPAAEVTSSESFDATESEDSPDSDRRHPRKDKGSARVDGPSGTRHAAKSENANGKAHRLADQPSADARLSSVAVESISTSTSPSVTAPNATAAAAAAGAGARIANRSIGSAGVTGSANASNRHVSATSGAAGPGTTGSRPESATKPAVRDSKQSNTADTISRIKLVQRVSKAFQHLGPEGGVVRLRLAPAELGSVRVEMRIQQKKVQARVVAETEAAGNALREHLPDLRARLEAFGMQVEKIEVETELSQDGSQSFEQSAFDQNSGRDQDRHRRQASKKNSEVSPIVSRAEILTPRLTGVSAGVDVRL